MVSMISLCCCLLILMLGLLLGEVGLLANRPKTGLPGADGEPGLDEDPETTESKSAGVLAIDEAVDEGGTRMLPLEVEE